MLLLVSKITSNVCFPAEKHKIYHLLKWCRLINNPSSFSLYKLDYHNSDELLTKVVQGKLLKHFYIWDRLFGENILYFFK